MPPGFAIGSGGGTRRIPTALHQQSRAIITTGDMLFERLGLDGAHLGVDELRPHANVGHGVGSGVIPGRGGRDGPRSGGREAVLVPPTDAGNLASGPLEGEISIGGAGIGFDDIGARGRCVEGDRIDGMAAASGEHPMDRHVDRSSWRHPQLELVNGMVRTREDRAERADAGFRVVCSARVVVDDVTPTIPSVRSGTAGGALDTACAPLELTQVATARASGIGRVISDERC